MMHKKKIEQGWSRQDIQRWFAGISQHKKRSYQKDVISRLQAIPANTVTLKQYGALSIDPAAYPLFHVTIGDLTNGKPNILVTGGVHGYEPSGVEAALQFIEGEAQSLSNEFNFVVYPCISPWSYEYDHRWNNEAQDPNRLFSSQEGMDSAEECQHFMTSLEGLGASYSCAVDLHETPDRDIELRQQRAERFGSPLAKDFRVIPNGFYLILTQQSDQNAQRAHEAFGCSIIDEVRSVSPIATDKTVLGKSNQAGMICSPPTDGLLRSYLGQHADYVGVTEVYPDHPAMSHQKSVEAQLAAIRGALKYTKTP